MHAFEARAEENRSDHKGLTPAPRPRKWAHRREKLELFRAELAEGFELAEGRGGGELARLDRGPVRR